jgi:hypothetical protein
VDTVASKIAPFSGCVSVGQTRVFKISDDPGPPAQLTPASFQNAEARLAGERVAIPWQSAKPVQPRVFGRGSADTCRTRVDRPLFAGNFAFVTYAEPGGRLGAKVFHLRNGEWHDEETVTLGYW